jgi:hypothetical protein
LKTRDRCASRLTHASVAEVRRKLEATIEDQRILRL